MCVYRMKGGMLTMHRGWLLVMIMPLVLISYCHLSAGARPTAGPSPSTGPAESTPAEGTIATGLVIPEKGEALPHPEVTPEESERLLQGTQRLDPKAVDNNPPSPPGLPPVPGRETKVAPSPVDPRSTPR